MADSEKSSLIGSSFFTLLLELWKKWDVRVMVLFSLILQIILAVLGRFRKFTINSFFKKIIFLTYVGADWIAIATLSKLSSHRTPHEKIVLRALWAPLLLLHLGGPDTITAYAFEENKRWIKHLFILVVKAILVIYFSWSTYIAFFLNFAGIYKYAGKILCLKLNSSPKTKLLSSNIFNPQDSTSLDRLLEENPNVLRGYLLFTVMRPDVNDYLSSHNLVDVGIKIKTYLKETTRSDVDFMCKYIRASRKEDAFKVVAVALGLMFDVLYTKFALIYSKLAWFLSFISMASTFSFVLFFVIGIIKDFMHFNLQEVGIMIITCILLIGAIALEFYSALLVLSSDWGILITELHPIMLVRKMFKVILGCFPDLKLRSKRWPDHMGQFDLLKYCWRCKKRKANQSCGILWKIINLSEMIEMQNKYKFTEFKKVPSYLKHENTYADLLKFIVSEESFRMSRGEKALKKMQQFEKLKWSIEFDFDHSIIVWHLATRVCYLQEDHHDEVMKISKYVSNYMMYLLAICPALLLSEHSRSFWLDYTCDNLKELMSPATNIRNAASALVADNIDEEELESRHHEVEIESSDHEVEIESRRETTLEENIQNDVSKLARCLNKSENKWKMIRDVWIEKLVYAAVSSQHMSHLKQLGEGIEFLSLIWLLVGHTIIHSSIFEEEVTVDRV